MTSRVLSGRYRLDEEIGRGGAGRVFRAYDLRLDRPIAVKVLTDLHEPAIERFRREAATAARVQHPNVVTLHDAGVDDGVPYLVMRLVEGASLATQVQATGPLAPPALGRLAVDLLSGLEATHAAGVLHRDLTPNNVLFDTDGTALLGDFGIARGADDPNLTAEHTVMGTRPFLAPERLQGHDATPASDLFAVGVTLRYAVTGSHGTPLPDGHTMAPLVAQCTEADPAMRPGSARAAAQLLSAPEPAAQGTTRALPTDAATDEVRRPAAADQPTEAVGAHVDAADVQTTEAVPEPATAARSRTGLVVALVAAVTVAVLLATNAIRSPSADQPSGGASTVSPTAGEPGPAPSFDPSAPADSARHLAEWLRERAG